ncbi:MAG: tetratricopeptide repeat-containing diguanylate cyclase [Candidatus Cloacimonadota bacterium]|nr:tetratricopeptide repeat-containing diguanylate cyclase [Candidatus Cloacimonadota bacterium]
MKKLFLLLILILLIINGYCLTRLDNLKLELGSATGLKQILILDELQRSYWKIYPQASLEYGIKALKLTTQRKDILQQTQQLQNIAISYKYLDNYKEAIEYMSLSLISAQNINNIDLQISAFYNLAKYNNTIEKNVIAFEYAVQALDLSKMHKNHPGLAKCRFIIAEIYYKLGDLKGAYENYELSLEQHDNFENKTSLALTNEKLGEIDLYNEDYHFAESHYKTAAENYDKINNLESLVRTYEALGKIYRKIDDKEKAYVYIQKFADTNEKLNQEINKNRFLFNYEYYNIIGNEDKALKYFKLYTEYKDSLQVAINQEQVETIISDIEIKHEIEKAETTKELIKITKTAVEKEKKIEELKIESDDKERASLLENDEKRRQIENLQREHDDNDKKIAKQKKEKQIFIFFLVIFIIVAILLFIIAIIFMSKYKMKQKHAIELEKIAKTDPLTQLPNRRAVLEQIEYETARFKRNAEPFTIVISDIDDFKTINDAYGHDAGDKVLTTLSVLMKNTIRKQDICARWGGEEFLFLFPGTDKNGGKIISEKIRKDIEKEKIDYKGSSLSITMTFGICTFSKALTIDECITRADKSLYEGKKLGKNRIVQYK